MSIFKKVTYSVLEFVFDTMASGYTNAKYEAKKQGRQDVVYQIEAFQDKCKSTSEMYKYKKEEYDE